ncbi:hypothetical protein HYT25_01585 [Candidatus Pacearchaeota archaeon]|nr:hypothetical protein [Candidatus Pacearchaeota archaeon]
MPEDSINFEIEERKKKVFGFLKEKKEWITYLILAFIIFISLYIRTRNIPLLKDITTNDWTLAPDLDPFLFLRWAKYIVENGTLFAVDTMRYVPLGYDVAGELKTLSYLIAWFYHGFSFFNSEITVTYAAILFPVFMFGLTGIAFFLFARKIFYKEKKGVKNTIALIATAFFVLIPSLLPRTIAGIPEKESAAFFFMFISFYFFLEAFTSEKFRNRIIFGFLSGFATAMMALVWGGVIYVFFSIGLATLLAFLLGKVKKEEIIIYGTWLFTSFVFMIPFSTRYAPYNLLVSDSTGSAIGVFGIICLSLFFMKIGKFEETRKKTGIPKELFYFFVSGIIIFVLVIVFLGLDFVVNQAINVKNSLVNPQTSRFGLTVAENKQPFFINDWKQNFGPVFREIPLYFWLFFTGAVVLFNNLIEKMGKKEKMFLTFSYFVFLVCLIFSKYSPGTILNGTSGLSILIYFFGWIYFIGTFGYFYYKRHKENTDSIFHEFNFSYILYFMVLTLGIIGSRAGIRLLMVLGAVSPIAVSFLIVKSSEKYLNQKEDFSKFFFGAILILILISSIFTLWVYYKSDFATGSSYAPGAYQQQWQKAMSWVRENTNENAVFAHWWDYGYWIQSIGERATILDGGNAMGQWNYLMGRLVLTGTNEKDALEFLYTHNGTHLLIDSTEIGKYAAFSSIGSDENYDRISYIPNLLMDNSQTKSLENITAYVYPSGFSLDEDIIINQEGKEILLPRKVAGIGAIILKVNSSGEILQPEMIFVHNSNQYTQKMRYVFVNGNLRDFGSGIDAGIFIFPRIDTASNGQTSLNNLGAAFYLSPRVVHSNLANLYLFGKESENFKLVHTESNLFVENLKQQGLNFGEFVYFQGFQGPIKIWEIKYPSDIKFNEEYLSIEYPSEELDVAKPGEY